ncbi:hypothetical protein BLAT2472_50065 [Burkholderia latens]
MPVRHREGKHRELSAGLRDVRRARGLRAQWLRRAAPADTRTCGPRKRDASARMTRVAAGTR